MGHECPFFRELFFLILFFSWSGTCALRWLMVTRAFICVIWLLVVVWETVRSFKRMKHLFHNVIGVITAVANLKFDIINVIFICSYIFIIFIVISIIFFYYLQYNNYLYYILFICRYQCFFSNITILFSLLSATVVISLSMRPSQYKKYNRSSRHSKVSDKG